MKTKKIKLKIKNHAMLKLFKKILFGKWLLSIVSHVKHNDYMNTYKSKTLSDLFHKPLVIIISKH